MSGEVIRVSHSDILDRVGHCEINNYENRVTS